MHGAAGALITLLPDDALVIEIQPGESWHTGFVYLSPMARVTHVLVTLPNALISHGENHTFPLFENNNNEWRQNRDQGRSVDIDSIIGFLQDVFGKTETPTIRERVSQIAEMNLSKIHFCHAYQLKENMRN
jgi:hypothetical protein